MKQNLHVHSIYSDGKSSPEEILDTAVEMGFTSIGFSEHSSMYWAPERAMAQKNVSKYHEHVNNLKKQYANKIEVFLGLELDIFSEVDLSDYDYVIGSVHYLHCDGKKVGMDRSLEEVKSVIDTYFNSDGMKYAKAYWETVAQMHDMKNIDILGHVDLVSKHCEKSDLFDTQSKEYRNCAIESIEAISRNVPIFEVNTGAISRGYRTTPYPDPYLLKEMKRLNMKPLISSDCHEKSTLDTYYKEAEQLLLSCGFNEIYILTKDGFIPEKIKG